MQTVITLDESEIKEAVIAYVASGTKGVAMKNPQAKLMYDYEETNCELPICKCEVSFEEDNVRE